MTFYRGMDIGTAKPSFDDRALVRHHLIDCLAPTQSASVDWFLKSAESCVDEIRSRGRQSLFVGGTPLYLKAALRGLFEGPAADPAIRRQLEADAELSGSAVLHARLARVDGLAAGRIHPNDLRRIVRALEVFEATGKPISEWQNEFDRPAQPPPKVICLTRPRDELYERINRRVLEMFEAGWVDEVQALGAGALPLSREASQAVGYREIADLLRGKMTKSLAIETIQRRTRQFAKHQMTWFRHIEEIQWLEIGDLTHEAALKALVQRFGESSNAIGSRMSD